jgi:hypothetical protein
MYKTGIATFTLDEGKCPKWLFERMTKLSKKIIRVIVEEYGEEEFIRRIADPVWFQSLGTVLAFDWNSSGLTTVLTAALKEAIKGDEDKYGIFICGGKGKTSRKTPEEIINWGEKLSLSKEKTNVLVYTSKMVAKVDSALIQDGYQIYHHTFFFTRKGTWTVVQQGMNLEDQTARRYHWHSENVKSFVSEPHTGIVSETFKEKVLNLTAKESEKNRETCLDLVRSGYYSLLKDLELLEKYSSKLHKILTFKASLKNENTLFVRLLKLEDKEYKTHPVIFENFFRNKYLKRILWQICEEKPKNYEELLAIYGVGPRTVRALALVAEIIYGAKPSYQDPARYSFAHGGKDGTPYHVDRKTYDETIKILSEVIKKTKLPFSKKKNMCLKLYGS